MNFATDIGAAFDILSLTSILVLLVLGMGVIVSMMRIFNLAHGELVLLGATVTWQVTSRGGSPWLGILLAPLAVGAVGVALERALIRRFYERPVAAMLATWGVGVVIREAVRSLLGGLSASVPSPLPGTVTVAGVTVSQWRIAIVAITLLVLLASLALLKFTSFGLQVRATLANPTLARASGIRVDRLYMLAFGFGAALAGLAGALVVPLFSLYAELGVTFLVRSFLGVMVGGLGTFEAPVVGAGLVGVASGGLPWLMAPVLADICVFVLAIVVIRVKPQGLMGVAQ